MSYLKKLFLLFLIAFLVIVKAPIAFIQLSSEVVRWVVEKNSTLSVQGSSNVNSFSCNIDEYVANDTLILANSFSEPIKLSGDLRINVEDFNCHRSLITNDLRKTLKSNNYPKMVIRFLSLETMPSLNKTEMIKGWIEVQLAGVVKRFQLNYSFSTFEAGDIHLNGGRSFSFLDFKLTPPHKLGGLIKVKDDFDVDFKLILRPV